MHDSNLNEPWKRFLVCQQAFPPSLTSDQPFILSLGNCSDISSRGNGGPMLLFLWVRRWPRVLLPIWGRRAAAFQFPRNRLWEPVDLHSLGWRSPLLFYLDVIAVVSFHNTQYIGTLRSRVGRPCAPGFVFARGTPRPRTYKTPVSR